MYSEQNEVDQLIAHLKRLTDQNTASLIKEDNDNRIAAYNEKAAGVHAVAKQLKKDLKEINGEIYPRLEAYLAKQAEIQEKREIVKPCIPDFEALEKDGLHLGIPKTPAYLDQKFGNVLTLAIQFVQGCFTEMVKSYDALCDGILANIEDLTKQSGELEGDLQAQKAKIEELTEKAKAVDCSPIDPPYAEILKYNLQARVKHLPDDVKGRLDQLLSILAKIAEDNKAAIIEDNNRKRIEAYNEKAVEQATIADDYAKEISAVSGELAERRTTFLNNIPILEQKREASQEALQAPYADLEKDGIHQTVKHTPNSVAGTYASILSEITNKLNDIYKEMVQNFDALCAPIIENIRGRETDANNLPDALADRKTYLADLLEKCNAIQAGLSALDAPFQELTDFKLNYQVKSTPNDIHGFADQLEGRLKHLIQSNDAAMYAEECANRIKNYTDKASVVMSDGKAIEAEIEAIEGELLEKREKYFASQKKAEEEQPKIEELIPIYTDLETDQLHLNIEDTPSTIQQFFDNIKGHITTLVGQIDAAIARQKGLEIPEDQLAEFRETFATFDKDNSRSLVNYELNACLTALGEPASEEECTEIIKKYSNGGTEMLFEDYVKFMLDRFTKTESSDSTNDAFKAIAGNSPTITEEQLAKHFPEEEVNYLKGKMTPVEGGYDYKPWVDSLYTK